MKVRGSGNDKFGSGIKARTGLISQAKPAGHWGMTCKRDNEIIWHVEWDNIIVTAGLNYLIDAGLSGGTPITSWFIGLVTGASPTFAAADTTASHAGWTEDQNYDEATRVAYVEAGPSAGSVTNAASVAVFTMNATTTIGGAFLVDLSTKGGATGTLYAEGDFTPDRSVIDNDVLEVTAVFSVADDGV